MHTLNACIRYCVYLLQWMWLYIRRNVCKRRHAEHRKTNVPHGWSCIQTKEMGGVTTTTTTTTFISLSTATRVHISLHGSISLLIENKQRLYKLCYKIVYDSRKDVWVLIPFEEDWKTRLFSWDLHYHDAVKDLNVSFEVLTAMLYYTFCQMYTSVDFDKSLHTIIPSLYWDKQRINDIVTILYEVQLGSYDVCFIIAQYIQPILTDLHEKIV